MAHISCILTSSLALLRAPLPCRFPFPSWCTHTPGPDKRLSSQRVSVYVRTSVHECAIACAPRAWAAGCAGCASRRVRVCLRDCSSPRVNPHGKQIASAELPSCSGLLLSACLCALRSVQIPTRCTDPRSRTGRGSEDGRCATREAATQCAHVRTRGAP